MRFVRVNTANTHLLERFLQRAGPSLLTFRYFATRPFSIVHNHVCTWVIEENQDVEAYGHLDNEGGTIWLGVAVTHHARGKGLGRRMMKRLIDSAKALGIPVVRLSVDIENETASRLYERFGFRQTAQSPKSRFYEWRNEPVNRAVVSAVAFPGQSAEERIENCRYNELMLEFSGDMPYHPDMERLFLHAPIERFIHHHFPGSRAPLAFNLASSDESIRRQSILHCVNAIRLTDAVGAPFFSTHAGFCSGPALGNLGQQLIRAHTFDREWHWNLLLESVHQVVSLTADLPTGFLLENSLVGRTAFADTGTNPMLFVQANEMLRFLQDIADPRVGILLDTAHLKVSVDTLRLDLSDEAKQVLPFIRCVHHSDNNGLQDSGDAFGEDYWFLPFMRSATTAVHVLEVRTRSVQMLKRMERLLFS
jgi:RimJ/RimL family protein N-acetyltransferase/sugar phosphate isomerase/epimerase